MANWTEEQLKNYEARTGKAVNWSAASGAGPARPEAAAPVSASPALTAPLQGAASGAPEAAKPRQHKFGAVPDERHGHRVDSQTEAKHLDRLDKHKACGEVLFYLRQVPFHLPGRTKYVCDFQVFWTDGSITFEDPKGVRTPDFNSRMRLMEETFPWVCVELIGPKGERWPATRTMASVRQLPAAVPEGLVYREEPAHLKSKNKGKRAKAAPPAAQVPAPSLGAGSPDAARAAKRSTKKAAEPPAHPVPRPRRAARPG